MIKTDMIGMTRTFAALILALLLACIYTPPAHANAAEPPGLTVIVSQPPADLSLAIRFGDGAPEDAVQLKKEQKAWEAYYRFYYWMIEGERPSLEGAILIAESGGHRFEWPLPQEASGYYNNLVTLDIANARLASGQHPGRPVLLVSMRVLLTLLIEGFVFYAFGYRHKTSWITFAAVNLLTQGLLNAALSGPNLGGYWFFAFVFFEIVIFIVEAVTFALILKEHKRGRAVAYALAANLASLILGGLLIARLPV